LISGVRALRASGEVDGPDVILSPPPELPSGNPSLRLVVTSDQVADLRVMLPGNMERGVAGLIGAANLDPDLGSFEMILPLPDRGFERIELSSYFPTGEGQLRIEAAELILDHADERDRIRIVERTSNTLEAEVRDLPDYRILSFIDFMYPGWRVYVDGVEAPLLHAFSYFKGVEVPPGTHRVRFEFRSGLERLGVATSLVALLLTGALIAWCLRRRGRDAHGP
jgi:hypothetical protein